MKSQILNRLKLPDSPGVYFFKDSKNRTLYIGRATSIKNRVKSYFAKDLIETRGPRIVDMVTKSRTITFEKSDSVLEAIILEANLIKKFQPKYNVDEKDDKSWNYVAITDEEWPRLIMIRGRNLQKKTEVYNFKKIFGPYPAGGLLRDALKIIRRIFPYLDEKSFDPKHRAFYASIGLAPGLGLPRQEYIRIIRHLTLFLEGKKKILIKDLQREMMSHAKHHEFELAEKSKRIMYALEHIGDIALIKNENVNSYGGSLSGYRIEAYDVAHLSGQNVVGVMTVVVDGEAAKSEYRKFKISHERNDDAAALREILLRRFGHPEWPHPSLIVVDGGQIQLNIAKQVLAELKTNIPVVALVKDDKHKARGIITDESLTKGDPTILAKYKRVIILANAEAHRFAISYHKNLRKRSFLK
ncbi:MAG: GIY-YIG nuclease family protein [Patescibacteria group bacterium]|nr:GIY-YIG nuclease family protein [Patescibacteria group bacterium]